MTSYDYMKKCDSFLWGVTHKPIPTQMHTKLKKNIFVTVKLMSIGAMFKVHYILPCNFPELPPTDQYHWKNTYNICKMYIIENLAILDTQEEEIQEIMEN